jgi:hypothetical protein
MRTTSGVQHAGEPDGFGAVGGLADDGDVRLFLQDHAEACTDEGLVVGDQDADAHRAAHGRGAGDGGPGDATGCAAGLRRALTRHPPSRPGPAVTVPP